MSMNPPDYRPNPDDPDKVLDQLLESYRVEPASAALRARIRGQIRSGWRHALNELVQALGGWRVLAPALAFSLCLGVVMPLLAPAGTASTALSSDSLSLWELGQLSENTEFAL